MWLPDGVGVGSRKNVGGAEPTTFQSSLTESNLLLPCSTETPIASLAAQTKLPAVYPIRQYVEVGGLMSYGVNTADLHRRAATFVDKILKGAKPADLPVEQTMKFEL